LGFLSLPAGAIANTLYVSAADGNDGLDCGTETNPCASIQQAVNLSLSGDTILVASANYIYEPSLDPCSSETGVVCIEGKDLTILGGYDGTNWSTRDPQGNPTVIDGQDSHRGILVRKTFPGAPNDASLRMEGFTIRRGMASGSAATPEDMRGGGLKAGLVTAITLKDMVFEDNRAIGADTLSNDGGNGSGGALSISTSQDLPPVKATPSPI
jgi:hypothetical protein